MTVLKHGLRNDPCRVFARSGPRKARKDPTGLITRSTRMPGALSTRFPRTWHHLAHHQ